MVLNVTDGSLMFGTPLSVAQSSSVLSHVSDFFLILLAFIFVWLVLTVIIALVFVNKGRKKGQVLWTFIVSQALLLTVLVIAFLNLSHILLWLGGL